LVGLLTLISIALLLAEPFPTFTDLLFGAAAGISGVIGLTALYRGLADGQMGVIAALTAVVTAIVPVLVGIVFEGLPGGQQLIGFVIALTAVWFISKSTGETTIRPRDLLLALIAGLGFGGFLILIDQTRIGAVLWPLAAARIAAIMFLLTLVTVTRQRIKPAVNQLPIIVLAGIFDAGGNTFFALAAQLGRLDISAVLSSLYPATTVLLAWLILKERLFRQQWVGVAAALIAIVLITL
jgi:drug/metabolite transporter (DMT)-like permease